MSGGLKRPKPDSCKRDIVPPKAAGKEVIVVDDSDEDSYYDYDSDDLLTDSDDGKTCGHPMH